MPVTPARKPTPTPAPTKPPISKFTVRVLLHEPLKEGDYDRLHGWMALEGFLRTIEGPPGKWYHLPQAEYNLVGPFTLDEVVKKAKRAAVKRNDKFEVLGTMGGRAWHNLPPAPPPTPAPTPKKP